MYHKNFISRAYILASLRGASLVSFTLCSDFLLQFVFSTQVEASVASFPGLPRFCSLVFVQYSTQVEASVASFPGLPRFLFFGFCSVYKWEQNYTEHNPKNQTITMRKVWE